MRITYHIEGGFAHLPGLARPRTVDVDALAGVRAQKLRALAAHALASPPPARRPRRGADMQTCVVTIEDAGKSHTVSIAEPCSDPALAELVELLRALP